MKSLVFLFAFITTLQSSFASSNNWLNGSWQGSGESRWELGGRTEDRTSCTSITFKAKYSDSEIRISDASRVCGDSTEALYLPDVDLIKRGNEWVPDENVRPWTVMANSNEGIDLLRNDDSWEDQLIILPLADGGISYRWNMRSSPNGGVSIIEGILKKSP